MARGTRFENCYGFFVIFANGSHLFPETVTSSPFRKHSRTSGVAVTNPEIAEILKSLSQKNTLLVNCLGEIAYNYCVVKQSGAEALSLEEKKYLRRFSSAIARISSKTESYSFRKNILVKNPQLVRALSSIALTRLWPSEKY